MGPNFLASKSSISDSGEIDYPPISGLELPSQPMVDWSSKTIQEKIARLRLSSNFKLSKVRGPALNLKSSSSWLGWGEGRCRETI